MSRTVWWNGGLIPEAEARLSIYDSALMFGDMVFEMTRSFNKQQFKLKEHIYRLLSSARYVRIDHGYTAKDIMLACQETQAANHFEPDDEHRLMINITRGLLPMYGATGLPGPNLIVSDFPLRWTVAGMSELFDVGINCVIPSQRAIPARLLEPKVKNRSRLHYQMANIEVSGYEGETNWPLLLDPDGFVAEGTGYNFFIVKDGQLLTPEPRNILRGVSRDFIRELLSFTEKNIEPYDVYEADEAFVTGTPFCMLPVTSLNGVPIGTGQVGGVFIRLMDKWSMAVGCNIRGQIRDWDEGAKAGPSAYKFK